MVELELMKTLHVSSSVDDECGDLLWQRVDDEAEEEREDGEDNESDDELLELLPDEEDEGLQRVDEPAEAGGWTTGGTTGDWSHYSRLHVTLAFRTDQLHNDVNALG